MVLNSIGGGELDLSSCNSLNFIYVVWNVMVLLIYVVYIVWEVYLDMKEKYVWFV